MSQFLSEIECKLDAKGRLSLPSAVRKKLAPEAEEKFVANRGYDNCITLFPMDEWQRITSGVNQLDMFDKKNLDFARSFYRGATELELDSAGRLLLPKRLCEYAGIDKEIVLSAWSTRIEIWSKERFDQLLKDEPKDLSVMAVGVMNKTKGGAAGDLS
jgi:MraZ protein